MYRLFMLFIDFATLLFMIIVTIKERINHIDEVIGVSLIYILIILNISYVLLTETKKETWLSLYFKRKALEEKKKIKALQDK